MAWAGRWRVARGGREIVARGASSPVDRHPCSRRCASSQALFSVALCLPTSCPDLWRRVHPCFRHRDVGRLNAAPNTHQDQGFLTPRHAPRGALAQDPLWSRDPRHRHWPRGKARGAGVRVGVVPVHVTRYLEEPVVARIDLGSMPQIGQAESLHGGLLSLGTRYGQGQATAPAPVGSLPQTVGDLPPVFNSTSLR